MKKKLTPVIISAVLLLLLILPFGAAMHLSSPDGLHTVQYYSSFSLKPFGNANFAPFITAIISACILPLIIFYAFKPTKPLKKIIFFTACAAMILSLCPLFYCLQCYNWANCLIALLLFILAMMFAEQSK